MKPVFVLSSVFLVLAASAPRAPAQPQPGMEINLERIADGLTAPITLTHAGDGSGRLFVTDQIGQVRVIDDGILLEQPFLDVSSLMVNLSSSYDERGLLGLAFHPDFAANGRCFVYYSAPTGTPGMNHKSVLAEYKVSPSDPNIASPTGTVLLEVDQPQSNHNAGHLAFGPDGYLYVALGDGGGAGDQHGDIGNGQDTTTMLGSILRIDVSEEGTYSIPADNPFVGVEGVDEIFAYGFRNPFHFSFDRGGDRRLFCGDVGQSSYEEVDLVEKGRNYGWRITEGLHCFNPPTGCDQNGLELPIAEYDHSVGVSVIGGYVYRGSRLPALVGKYVFGDWTRPGSDEGRLFYLQETAPGEWDFFEFATDGGPGSGFGQYIIGFGEDEEGEIYVLSQGVVGPRDFTGRVDRIVAPAAGTPTPTRTSTPVPTSSPTPTLTPRVPADLNGDGKIDHSDLYILMHRWYRQTSSP